MFLLQNSQLGGFIDGLINGIMGAIGGILDFVFDWLVGVVWNYTAIYLYTSIIYPMLSLIDCVAILFRKFAGLGTFTSHGVQYTNTDFLYSLITNDTVMNVFWAMLILGVILLFITTFVAVIKSETTPLYDKNGGNNKVKVLKQTGRTILNFAIVPVCAVIGIMLGNVLLRTLDQATGGTNSVTGGMSARVFVSAAYNANRVRRAISLYEEDVQLKEGYLDWIAAEKLAQSEYKTDLVTLIEDGRAYELAQAIDDRYIGSKNNNPVISNDSVLGTGLIANASTAGAIVAIMDVVQVEQYYNIGQFNFILAIIEAVAILIMLINITIGLIKRLFAVVTLFVCAPPIVAVSPLQPTVLKEWNKAFISQVIAGYSSVVGMNMFLIILGALSDIQFFSTMEVGSRAVAGFMNSVIMILIMLAGLFFVKDVIEMVSKIIGGDNALKSGEAVAGKMAKVVGTAVGMATGTIAAAGLAAGKTKKLGTIGEGLNNAKDALNNSKKELDGLETKKDIAENTYKDRVKQAQDRLNVAKASGNEDEISKAQKNLTSERLQAGKVRATELRKIDEDEKIAKKKVENAEKTINEKKEEYKAVEDKFDERIKDANSHIKKNSAGFIDSIGENKVMEAMSGKVHKDFGMLGKIYKTARTNAKGEKALNKARKAGVSEQELQKAQALAMDKNGDYYEAGVSYIKNLTKREKKANNAINSAISQANNMKGNGYDFSKGSTVNASAKETSSFWGGAVKGDSVKIDNDKLNQIENKLKDVQSEYKSAEKGIRKLEEQNKKLEETLNNLHKKGK